MHRKGFTLIELLVVVSIIGLLSSVVLSALNVARAKGNDVAAKGDMRELVIEAQNYIDTVGVSNYGTSLATCAASGVFGETRFATILTHMQTQDAPASTATCATDSTGLKWAVSISVLSSAGTSWCVDNTQGWFKPGTAVTAAGATQGTCIP